MLRPGEYTQPGRAHGLSDLPGLPGGGGYPGIYRFDKGLWINPQSSTATVTGSNIVLATQSPYPVAGNVPGSGSGAAFLPSGAGNGAPCLPSSTMTSKASGNGTPVAETSSHGVRRNQPDDVRGHRVRRLDLRA